jgi:16S rRNA (uracil1498-N3)-methyltransferase
VRRRFFVDHFESRAAALRGETAEHLGRVLRAEPGQLYELSDGEHLWLARIEHVALSRRGENRIDFALIEPIAVSRPSLHIDLLLSLVKFDRFEWCLEKATELGADHIFPLAAARTDQALVAAAANRQVRWRKILVESAQQSRRLCPPSLAAAAPAETAFAQATPPFKILLSERPQAPPLRDVLGGFAIPSGPPPTVALAIGPEGGWTEAEFAASDTCKFSEASLGENILRTETAVLASLAILRYALLPAVAANV